MGLLCNPRRQRCRDGKREGAVRAAPVKLHAIAEISLWPNHRRRVRWTWEGTYWMVSGVHLKQREIGKHTYLWKFSNKIKRERCGVSGLRACESLERASLVELNLFSFISSEHCAWPTPNTFDIFHSVHLMFGWTTEAFRYEIRRRLVWKYIEHTLSKTTLSSKSVIVIVLIFWRTIKAN